MATDGRVVAPSPQEAPPLWWTLSPEAVAQRLDVDLDAGLTAQEAERRRLTDGPNELEERPPTPRWRMFLGQFANTMIVVLLIAAVITAVVGDVQDMIVIVAIVIANAVIGYVQEHRAEEAMTALKRMTSPVARLTRAGEVALLPAGEVVRGDLLLLDAGDVVAADARLVEAPGLRVNEAPLTGESLPVDKTVAALPAGSGALVAERHNMVFKGTSVVHGRGLAVVTATGMRTALGEIAELLQAHRSPQTPLQRRLAVLGQRLAAAALVVCALVFVTGVVRGEDVTTMFLTAVSLAVAAIPEALPAVVTVSLALGAQRLARHHALVRKLPAVETLGSVTVVCTDKTGTLTQGRMQVERVWTLPDGEIEVTGDGYEPTGVLSVGGAPIGVTDRAALRQLLEAGALCNDAALVPPGEPGRAWDAAGDPTEAALVALAAKAGVDPSRDGLRRIGEVPFDAERKLMTTVNEAADGRVVIATKGGPEAVVTRSVDAASDGERLRPLTEEDRRRILDRADAYAAEGYRVLGLAGARRDDPPTGDGEEGLTFFGLVAMADPLRPEVVAAVRECRTAGIMPVMITGDHPATARTIAERAGISDRGGLVWEGDWGDLAAGPHEGSVADVAIYARTPPERKLDIVEAWRAHGDVVAMTGDGVNDAPALRRADVGVAMGITGTEVAKEAGDIVLTDDNFATIVGAIREGRRIYDNIRRFVRYMLTANTGEIWVVALGPFLGLPLPLLPVQLLWINLVTDGLPGIALGVEPPERDVMRRPPRSPSESIFARGLWQHVLAVGLVMGAIPLSLGVWGEATGRPWQTMVFTSLALLQLGNAVAVRSELDSVFTIGLRTNPSLLGAVVGTLVLQIALLYWGPSQRLLDVEALSLADLMLVLAASTVVFWVIEAEKLVRRLSRRRAAEPAAVRG
jgi:Ca2+-transporting ATPase